MILFAVTQLYIEANSHILESTDLDNITYDRSDLDLANVIYDQADLDNITDDRSDPKGELFELENTSHNSSSYHKNTYHKNSYHKNNYHNSVSTYTNKNATLVMDRKTTHGSGQESSYISTANFTVNKSVSGDKGSFVKYKNVSKEVHRSNYMLPHIGKSEHDDTWLTIDNTFRIVHIYNIFWDNREGLYHMPVLRVLTISTTGIANSRAAAPRYYVSCHVTCEPGGRVFEIPHRAAESVKIYQPRMVLQVTYVRHVFVCDLSGGPCELPHRAVLLMSQYPNSTHPDQLNQTNSLSVEYPAQEGEVERIHVGVCGPLLYGTVDPYRLIEWLEMLKLLGVETIVMHNHSMDQSTADIMKVYKDEGLVELRQVRQQGIVGFLGEDKYRDDIYAIGTILLTDCMYRNMFRFDWMAVLDLDELIIPRNHRNYSSLLKELNQNQNYQNRVGFKFLHADFILDSVLNPQLAEGVPWQMAIPRHQQRFGVMRPTFHAKSIIKPKLCTAMHYHICRGHVPNIDRAIVVSNDNAMDCHFRSKLCPDNARNYTQCLAALNYGVPLVDNIALTFKDGLYKAMNPQLRRLGLETIT